MGIYSDGNIYGIGWTVYDSSDDQIVLFERISNNNKILLEDEILEIKAEYDKFQNNIQNNIQNKKIYDSCTISYKIYTSCSSTHERGGLNDIVFMKWFPITKKSLDNMFLKGEKTIII